MIVAAAASKARRGIKSERIEERKRERWMRSDDDDDLNSFLFVRNDRRREGEIGDKRGASGRVLLIIMRFGKMLFGGIAAVIRAAAVSRLVILAGECTGLG